MNSAFNMLLYVLLKYKGCCDKLIGLLLLSKDGSFAWNAQMI
jgi:hypothetical protein